MHIKQKHRGFTFTELMVALVINFIIFAALITVFNNNLTHYNKTISSNRLFEQLQGAMLLMTSDIRRAGFWANAANDVGLDQNNNPFMTNAMDISINGSNNCILFGYDRNSDGALATISSSSDDERYGFRLMNGVLQARPPGASFACDAAATNWENVTDPSITVTALTFTLNQTTLTTGPGVKGTIIRSVDITLTGRLAADTTVTKTLTQHVRIRNDKFIP